MTLKKLWQRAVDSAYVETFVYGRVGKHNTDTSVDYAVPGRTDYLWVTLSDRTVKAARNEAGVPQTEDLQVKLRVEHGEHVIVGRSTNSSLSVPSETPPSGVLAHATAHQHGGSDEVATATPAANAIPKADGSGKLDGWVTHTDVAGSINAATEKVTLADDDRVAGTDSAASNVLTWWKWSTIKAALQATFLVFTQRLYIFATSVTGPAFIVNRDLPAASTDAPVVTLVQDNAGDDQTLLLLQQDGSGDILLLLDGAVTVLRVTDGGVTVLRRGTTGSLLDVGGLSITEGANVFNTGFWRGGDDNSILFNIVATGAGASAFSGGVDGDTFRRFRMRVDGSIVLGPGNATQDTTIERSAGGGIAITSLNGGLLVPRMTTTQRNAMTTITNGMIIYNTTTATFQGYEAGAWRTL